MATPAHSHSFEKGPPLTRPKSADQIAIERWGGRQLRLAQSVASFLYEIHEGEWHWEASDNFFGTPVDSAVITGSRPNGDGTHSGIFMVGDMDILGPLLRASGMDMRDQRPNAETLLERIHWADPFWGPFPLPYYLTLYFEEMKMSDITNEGINKKAESLYKRNEGIINLAILLVAVIGCALRIGMKISEVEGRIGHVETAIYGDPKSPVNEGLVMRSAQTHAALYGEDGKKDGIVYKVNEISDNLGVLMKSQGLPATSADTRSSKPHTTKDGSPTP